MLYIRISKTTQIELSNLFIIEALKKRKLLVENRLKHLCRASFNRILNQQSFVIKCNTKFTITTQLSTANFINKYDRVIVLKHALIYFYIMHILYLTIHIASVHTDIKTFRRRTWVKMC